MARKQKHPEHVNHERWLISYADFITLLFAFFTALYAISSMDAKKAGKMMASTRAAFNLDMFPNTKPTLGTPSVPESLQNASMRVTHEASSVSKKNIALMQDSGQVKPKSLAGVYEELRKLVDTQKIQGVNIRATKNGIVISLRDAAFFDPSSADIRKVSLPALDLVAEKVLATKMDIRVEGHTDDTKVASTRYRSNWELSTARAVSVVRYFMQQFAYPPDMVSVAGYGSYKPLGPNDTAEGRAANRRVDIVLLAPKGQPAASPPAQDAASPESPAEGSLGTESGAGQGTAEPAKASPAEGMGTPPAEKSAPPVEPVH